MEKRLLLFLFAMLTTVSTWAYFEVDGICYSIEPDWKSVGVVQKTGQYSGDVVIPSTVTWDGETFNVTVIGNAFYGCSNLTSVTIPNSVTTIAGWAFYECTSLTSITIPNSVTQIGCLAFYGCTALTSVTIPDGVVQIPWQAFYGCTKLSSVVIPNSVVSIDEEAFGACVSLASVNIPDGVTWIGGGAFSYCYNLESVTIPNGVTWIGGGAFSDCYNLESVAIPNSVETIGIGAFQGCSKLTSVVLSDKLTSISDKVFYDCRSLESIVIPNSVTSIGDEAFGSCENLSSVIIGNGVKEISETAFNYCNKLSSENEYGNALYLGTLDNPYLFLIKAKNTDIKSCDINENTRIIKEFAFSNCTGLTSIVIPNGVNKISSSAFRGCSSLNSIAIPNSVTEIGALAFQGCSKLNAITIPDGVTTIEDYMFQGCSSLTTIDLPNDVTSIGEYAFQACRSLTSIDIPNNLKSIRNYVFQGCTGLTSVSIPDGVVEIGVGSFNGCIGLKSITIPKSVGSIGYAAFGNCGGLETIIVDSENSMYDSRYNCNAIIETSTNTLILGCANTTFPSSVLAIGSRAFTGCRFTSVSIPTNIKYIGESAFQGCNELVTITVDEGHTIYDSRNNCNAIIEKATNRLIAGCAGTVIPPTVVEIANSVFDSCSGLTTITIPDGTAMVGSYALGYCDNLRTVVFESVTPIEIGMGADWSKPAVLTFIGSENIEVFYVPDGTKTAYKAAWGDTYVYDWSYNTKKINYVEIGQLPQLENTLGGNAVVVDVADNEVTLSIKLDEGFSIGQILVNDIVVFPVLNKSGKTISVADLGGGKYLVSGVTNADYIKVVYSDGNDTPTAIENITILRPVREGIYNLQGQKLTEPQRGINIIDGKKVIVR